MKTFFVLQFGFVTLAAAGVLQTPGDGLVRVNTLNGVLEGFYTKSCRNGTPFAAFRGIPYAEPPIGQLRFRDPVPKKNWEGVWDATYQRSSCLQGSFGGDEDTKRFYAEEGQEEDCLYLNVYTPNVNYLKTGKGPLKAVMIFIHMGAFIMGSGSESATSPDFLVDQDVIVVTFNYRLGALGFLSLQNSDVPGNAGLKDQNLVLKWVKNNIKNFGGDPNKVTIFGESAGSASVNYHMISGLSAGLFRNAIMQSGTTLASWAYSSPDMALEKSKKLGRKIGCKHTSTDELLKCMQGAPAELVRDLQQKALTLKELVSLRVIAFNPTTEPDVPGAFITTSPFDLMFSGNFSKVPVIIGSTADEGLLLYPILMKNDPHGILLTLVGLDLSRFAPSNFHLNIFSKMGIEFHQKLSHFYFKGKLLSKSHLREFLELITDTMFVVPIQLTAGLLADQSVPVYNYQFSYDGSYGLGKVATNIPEVPGVSHGDDNGYIFYVPSLHTSCGKNASAEATPMDELMVSRMTKMWANFAKYGNPTPKIDNEIPVVWKPFTPTERNYLEINTMLVPSDSLKLSNMMFWDDLIKRLIENENAHNPQDIELDDFIELNSELLDMVS